MTKFDKVIALTESDKKMWNLPNIFVIPNFSNIQLHERNGRKSKVAISAGRLESVKGYNRLIAAWVIVAQSVRTGNWKFGVKEVCEKVFNDKLMLCIFHQLFI